ncbi:ISNCY family transposase, partial [Cupriavidus respiraculi]|nr:ISNCY family transposase [Cupriavidus respiraculi]
RFAKVPRSDFDAHRPVRGDEDLTRIFTWREWRKVSQNLTLQYDKVVYLLQDCVAHRKLIHRTIEVAEYPDGRIELWADGAALPYSVFDPRETIRQADIVEHKRLGHVLEIAARVQALREDRQTAGPARTLSGGAAMAMKPTPGAKRKRQINRLDLERAIAGSTAPPC